MYLSRVFLSLTRLFQHPVKSVRPLASLICTLPYKDLIYLKSCWKSLGRIYVSLIVKLTDIKLSTWSRDIPIRWMVLVQERKLKERITCFVVSVHFFALEDRRGMSRIDRSNEKHDFITSTLKQRKQHNLET